MNYTFLKKLFLALIIIGVNFAFLSLSTHTPANLKNNTAKAQYPTPFFLNQKAIINLNPNSITFLAKKNIENEIITYCKKNILNLKNSKTDLVLSSVVKSNIGTHYTFRQTYESLRVYGTVLKITLNNQNQLIATANLTYNFDDINIINSNFLYQKNTNPAINKNFETNSFLTTESPLQKIIFVQSNTQAQVAFLHIGSNIPQNRYEENIINENAKILYTKNLQRGYQHHNTEQATALVFNPDPLTSEQKNYGTTGYTDNQDADSPQLTAARKTVTIECEKQNNTFYLKNNMIEIADLPNQLSVTPATSQNGVFDYTRSQTQFEDANVFYHISTLKNYLNSLNLNCLISRKVYIDPHSSPQDNSFHTYNFQSQQHQITLGIGGIDDGEDADVAVHEYGHAVSYFAADTLYGFSGNEETISIDEGFCDYVAAAYSYNLNNFNWQKVFNWDGNTAQFTGRSVNKNLHYPEDLTDNRYHDCQIWSSALMAIHNEIGRETTDKIVLNALCFFHDNIDMKQAANYLLKAEEQLFNKQYRNTLLKHLTKYGLSDYLVFAGNDTTVCLGATLKLGSSNAPNEYPNTTITWFPDNRSLSNIHELRPQLTANYTSYYILNVTDNTTNLTFSDTVKVTVNTCFEQTRPSQPTQITLINTQQFTQGLGNLYIEVPFETTQTQLLLYNAQGKLAIQQQYNGNNYIEVKSNLPITQGLYFLWIKTNNNPPQIFKIIKAG